MRNDHHAIGQQTCQGPGVDTSSHGFSWRHLATVLLLLVTLPVFMAAGAVALLVLPAVLLLVGLNQIRQLARPQPRPVPIRISR
jgi:hypothetical protein